MADPNPIVLCPASTTFPDATGGNAVVSCHRVIGHPDDEHGHVAQFEGEDDEGERWVTRVQWYGKKG